MKTNARKCSLLMRLSGVLLVVLSLLGGSARAQNLPSLLETLSGPPAPGRVDTTPRRTPPPPPPNPISSVAPARPGELSMPDVTRMLPTTSDPGKLTSSLQIVLLLSLLTLAPSILLMTTCFTRVVIVLSLLRQAIGTAQLPPNQIVVGLALFITFLVMGPTWNTVQTRALAPYQAGKITQLEALDRSKDALRDFMIRQIVAAHNEEDVYLFHGYSSKDRLPKTWSEVSTLAVIPAFILSELKVSFLMGFRIYLPFLIIDMVISSVLISIGMQLLPPVLVSLPFKLLLFVLVDGWHLITATLLSSFN